MANYGEIRFRLKKAYPSVDQELIDGWINDRYAAILSELPWSRLNVDTVLRTVAEYTAGTVSLTAGSTAVTGDSTAWVTGMTGRQFRVTGRSEIYTFTWTTGTTGTLDRPYEGPTAAGLGYKIFQSLYSLPANARMISDDGFDGLDRMTPAQLRASSPGLPLHGEPAIWTWSMDASSCIQVELYPFPTAAVGIPYSYVAEQSPLSGTGTALLVWMQPGCIVAGATADIKSYLKDYAGAALEEQKFSAQLARMRDVESHRMAPTQCQLADHYTDHRIRRWNR